MDLLHWQVIGSECCAFPSFAADASSKISSITARSAEGPTTGNKLQGARAGEWASGRGKYTARARVWLGVKSQKEAAELEPNG